MTGKVDFKKTMKELYAPSSSSVSIVDVPRFTFLMIDGSGSPGDSKEYKDALATLYPVAFKTKFLSKNAGRDYVVPPLEGLWWADNMEDFRQGNRDKWKWTMMIMVPDFVSEDIVLEALDITRDKKPELIKHLAKMHVNEYKEGTAAQIMHRGPYSEEGPTIDKLHAFITERGGTFDGHEQKHHEIYLSDPRRAKPENMRTVIRQPCAFTDQS